MVINHVTFNENVECHQYSPTFAAMQQQLNREDNITESSSVGGPRLKYTTEFLKELRNSPVSQICPDAVKKGAKDGKEWAGGEPQSFPISRSTNRSVFSRPFNHQPNYQKMRRNYVPYFGNNQNNYGGFNSEEMNEPIEPIGSSRYTAQNRNYQNRNPVADNVNNFAVNGNLMPEFAQLCDQKKTTNEEDEPEWYRAGPTSPNDFIDLHGFEGPHQDNHDNHTRNEMGCVDGNVSGGPTSGASSNNGSPPAKSTPAKVTFNISKDAQRNRRPDMGRPHNWQQNNCNTRQNVGAPFLSELFKNYSSVQNQSNLRGLTPIVSVQDVESSLLYDRLKFKQMISHLQTQNLQNCRNLLYPQPIPTASQVLSVS